MKTILLILVLSFSISGCANLFLPAAISKTGYTEIKYDKSKTGKTNFSYKSGKEFKSMSLQLVKDPNDKITTLDIKINGVKAFEGAKTAKEALIGYAKELQKMAKSLGLKGLLIEIFASKAPELPPVPAMPSPPPATPLPPPPEPTPPDPSLAESNQFLWKAISDGDGKLAILLPAKYTGKTTKILEIYDANGTLLDTGRYIRPSNGNRETYRFSKPGAGYSNNLYVKSHLKDGTSVRWDIPIGGNRTELR